jgi:hypothetical protein
MFVQFRTQHAPNLPQKILTTYPPVPLVPLVQENLQKSDFLDLKTHSEAQKARFLSPA